MSGSAAPASEPAPAASLEPLLLPGDDDGLDDGDSPLRWERCKLYSRITLALLYSLVAVFFSVLVWQMVVRHAEKSSAALAAAGVAVLIAVPLSLHDMHAHLQNYVSPLQRHYVRIMGLVPIYALESWLALAFRGQRVYVEVLREAYEAFVVYSLFRLLLEALGERPAVVALLRAKGGAAHFLPPLRWLLPDAWRWPLGELFVARCERCVLQYVVLRVALAGAALAAEWAGALCEGFEDPAHCAAPYINGTILVSQFVAMYALVAFYDELAAELAPVRALNKLLAVKAVVFLSFFQGVVISGLFYVGILTETPDYSAADLAAAAQNFLICWEMLLAAAIHHCVFSRREFKTPGKRGQARFSTGS